MNRIIPMCLAVFFGAASMFAQSRPVDPNSQATKESQSPRVTIEGLVRDIACPVQNPAAKATTFNLECALECARNGSPLVIQTKEGELYIPISDSMPDKDQHEKLMPFVGKYVRASGTVFERKGTRAIVIAEIKELKDVPLKTDAK
jgi:hypothetical protein